SLTPILIQLRTRPAISLAARVYLTSPSQKNSRPSESKNLNPACSFSSARTRCTAKSGAKKNVLTTGFLESNRKQTSTSPCSLKPSPYSLDSTLARKNTKGVVSASRKVSHAGVKHIKYSNKSETTSPRSSTPFSLILYLINVPVVNEGL